MRSTFLPLFLPSRPPRPFSGGCAAAHVVALGGLPRPRTAVETFAVCVFVVPLRFVACVGLLNITMLHWQSVVLCGCWWFAGCCGRCAIVRTSDRRTTGPKIEVEHPEEDDLNLNQKTKRMGGATGQPHWQVALSLVW